MKYLVLFTLACLLASCGSTSGAKFQSYQGENSAGFSYGTSDKPISPPPAPRTTDPGYRMGSDGRPATVVR